MAGIMGCESIDWPARVILASALRGNPSLTKSQWRAVLYRDGCVYCGGPAKKLDHIHPKSKGGPNGWWNRAPTCPRCEQMKADHGVLWMLIRFERFKLDVLRKEMARGYGRDHRRRR